MNDKFMKFDGKKNRLELIEPEFILGLGKVLSFGAEKYDAWNWRKMDGVEDTERIKGAALRHMMAYLSGEKFDPETGISHLHHMSCNLMFLDYFDRNEVSNEVNNEVSNEHPIDKVLRGSQYYYHCNAASPYPYQIVNRNNPSDIRQWSDEEMMLKWVEDILNENN